MQTKKKSVTRQSLPGLGALSLAVALSLSAQQADAAGLGRLKVLSSLGQPLNAEIELTAVSPTEADELEVKLASYEAYAQANRTTNEALRSLSFKVNKKGGRHVVNITSSKPFNEPFVGMLLELTSASSRVTREYTFLLDPPEMRSASTTVSAPVIGLPSGKASSHVGSPDEIRSRAQAIKSRGQSDTYAAPVERQSQGGGGEYRVKTGDTLSGIAKAHMRDDLTLSQMLVALYRNNPNAFIGKNMNRLRAGKVLHIPENMKIVSDKEARKIVRAHSSNFSSYSGKLAGYAERSAPRKAYRPGRSSEGRVTARVQEEGAPVGESLDKLKLSKADERALRKSGKLTAEEKTARSRAAAESDARTKELEKNISELEKLLQVKNKELSEQQRRAELERKQATEAEQKAQLARAEEERKQAEAELKRQQEFEKQKKLESEKIAADLGKKDAAGQQQPGAQPAQQGALPSDKKVADASKSNDPSDLLKDLDSPRQQNAQQPNAVGEDKGPVPAPSLQEDGAPKKETPKPKPKRKKVAPPPPPPPEPSLIDELIDNPLIIGGAAVVAGLLGYFLIRRRRGGGKDGDKGNKPKKSFFGKKEKEPVTSNSVIDMPGAGAAASAGASGGENSGIFQTQNSIFGNQGGQNVDTNNSIFNSNFAPSAGLVDANEVDPIAEADVYIAYKREEQAIEILKEALRAHPERNALRVKLLEVYASQKDVQEFDALASELYGLTRGEGEEWAFVASLGASLSPENPLYKTDSAVAKQAQASQETIVHQTPAASAPAQPTSEQIENPDFLLDIGGDDAATNAVDNAAASAAKAVENKVEEVIAPQHEINLELPQSSEENGLNFEDFDIGTPSQVVPKEEPKQVKETSFEDFDLGNLSLASSNSMIGGNAQTSVPTNDLNADIEMASTYLSMGDADAARKLLSKVINNGTDEQVKRAMNILGNLPR